MRLIAPASLEGGTSALMQRPSFEPVFVTVIMPVRNEAKFIERSLGAVLNQDYPHEFLEVLIADGMSVDGTPQVIARVAKAHPDIPVSVINNPRRIVPTGFNLALRRARGKVIVRVDGHTIIAPDYIRQCVMALQATGGRQCWWPYGCGQPHAIWPGRVARNKHTVRGGRRALSLFGT